MAEPTNAVIPPLPHIGNLLYEELQRKHAFKVDIARTIGCPAATLNGCLRHAFTTPKTLWALSHALSHNFFARVAALLPAGFEGSTAPATAARIAGLEERIKMLEAEGVLLKK